jgi:hypothetical protein
MKHIEKECNKHGLTKFVIEGRGYYRCAKCRSENVSKRRRKLKQTLVEYKGGKCEKCGYDKCVAALDFHHLDINEKQFNISKKGLTLSVEKMKKEVDKCILLCANCHRETHSRLDNSNL